MPKELFQKEAFLDAGALASWKMNVYSCKRLGGHNRASLSPACNIPALPGLAATVNGNSDKLHQGPEKQQAVFFLETSRGPKRLVIEKSIDVIRGRGLLAAHLANNGFDQLSRPILNSYGEPFAEGVNGYYYLTDWHDLRPLALQDEKAAAKAGSFLACFHIASRGFSAYDRPLRLGVLSAAKELLGYRPLALRGHKMRREMAFVCRETAKTLEMFPPETENALIRELRRESCLCLSGDPLAAIGVDESGELWLNGLDYCCAGAGATDLAELFLCLFTDNFEPAMLSAGISSYLSLRRLSPPERRLLAAALMLPHRTLLVMRRFVQGEYNYTLMEGLFLRAVDYERKKSSYMEAVFPLLGGEDF